MQAIQITVHLPENFKSIEPLETSVNDAGQKVKQRRFEKTFAQIVAREKQRCQESAPCPSCGNQTGSIGRRRRKLLTVFGEVELMLPRRKCQVCQTTFGPIEPLFSDFCSLQNSNTTQPLKQLAILCGSSWPYRQAAKMVNQLTGIKMSAKQVQRLCKSQGEVLDNEFEQMYQQHESLALVQTMESLVKFMKAPPRIRGHTRDNTHRVYIAIDGTFVNAKKAKKHFEAKAAIVFTAE